jgi:hypothetical protein
VFSFCRKSFLWQLIIAFALKSNRHVEWHADSINYNLVESIDHSGIFRGLQ